MSSQKPTFQERSHQMSKLQIIFLDRQVAIAGGSQAGVAKPIISSNGASTHNSVLNKGGEAVAGSIRKNAKTNSPNAFIPSIFDSNSYQNLACSTTTSFARLFSTNVGFVHFNDTRQVVTAGAHHGTTQFMQPCPSRAITAQTKDAFEPKCTGSIFLSSYPPY